MNPECSQKALSIEMGASNACEWCLSVVLPPFLVSFFTLNLISCDIVKVTCVIEPVSFRLCNSSDTRE